MADAILSSKMPLAQAHGIDVRVDAHIPIKLRISELDLCCVLGNLFDNAIEANDGLPEADRMIRVYMDMKGTQPYISLTFLGWQAAQGRWALPHHQIRRGARFRVGPHRSDHRGCGRLPESQLRGRRLHHGDSAAAVLQQGCAVDVVQGPAQVEVPPQTQLRGRPLGRVHQHARRLHGPVPGQENQDGVRAQASWPGAGCWALWHDRW